MINVLSDNSNSKINTGVTDEKGRGGNGGSKTDSGKDGAPKPTKPRAPRVTKFEQVECPQCRQGHILKGRTAYGCSRYKDGCALRLNFTEYPESLTPSKLKKAIAKNWS